MSGKVFYDFTDGIKQIFAGAGVRKLHSAAILFCQKKENTNASSPLVLHCSLSRGQQCARRFYAQLKWVWD